MIKLTVNGEPREFEGPLALLAFLESLGVNAQMVAVALNGTVLQKGKYDGITLKDGDTLEVVRPVGGG